MERAPGLSPEDWVPTSSWPSVPCSTAGSPGHRFTPRGTSPWPGASPRRGHLPHLISLCPTSTSSYTMSSWETDAVNQNATEKIIRRCRSEPGTQNNVSQRQIEAAASRSTQRCQGNAKGRSSGLQKPGKTPAQGRVPGFVSCVYGQFSGRVWPSSSRDGAGAAAKPQLHAVASPGRVSTPRTWVCSLQHLLKAWLVGTGFESIPIYARHELIPPAGSEK